MAVRDGGRRILLHGLLLILVGLVWGLFVQLTPYPRLALTAHIQFLTNGLLLVVLAVLLLGLHPAVGSRSVRIMLLAAWLTWPMALSEVANAWWGTNQMLPLAAAAAGATGGAPWQELTLQLTHVAAALGLIAAWALLVLGFVRRPPDAGASEA